MTTIAILGGDFEILFDDETVGSATTGMKMVRRATGASETVYTSRALYSDIAASTDEFTAMGFKNPMLPVTPNAYTMENFFFIPRSSTEYLKEGAITCDWTIASTEGILRKEYTESVPFVPGDIGDLVTETTSGDTGTLLDYEVEPDGTTILWIRPDDAATDIFALTTAVTSAGTGVASASVAATNGESLYSSIQAIGSVPTATEVYLVQDRQKIGTSADNTAFQFWATDPTLSLGIIDILLRVKTAGVDVADGDVEVFSRRYTSLYDNFRLNVIAGGRSALPLASAPDINNTTGYLRATLSGASGTWDVGNHWYIGASYAAATAKGVITVGGSGATPTIEYYLIGDLTDISNTTITEYDPVAAGDGDASATGSGASSANLLGPTDATAGEGGTVTITLGKVAGIDHDGDGNNEEYSVVVNCQTDVVIAKVYERLKYVTRRGATATELFGAGVNMPGESYRGMDGVLEWDATSGAQTQGDDLLLSTGGTWTARLMSYNATATPDTYITVMDQQTSIDLVLNDNVADDESANTVTIAGDGSLGINTVASVKSSPFGTFTGSQIFGARGIAFTGIDQNPQAYIAQDDLGNLLTPPNTVTITVNTTIALDRILVARDAGGASPTGVIDKDQFGGIETPAASYNRVADREIRGAAAGDTEIPASGTVRVVLTTLNEEHRYRYVSRTIATNATFTLVDQSGNEGTGVTTPSTPDANGNATLTDTTATFTTGPAVEVGDLVRNTTITKRDQVWEVTGNITATTLGVRWLYGPKSAAQDWDNTDTYEINAIVGNHDDGTTPTNYATSDNLYDTIIDEEATGSSVNTTLVKTPASDYAVVMTARQGKVILPFTINPSVDDNGMTQSVVRTTDTIAQ